MSDIIVTVTPASSPAVTLELVGSGPRGPAGPNVVSGDTDTTLVGLLKGADGKVAAAVPDQDYVAPDDERLSDARTPTAHSASHQHGGGDEVATVTPSPNAIPKAGDGGKLERGWIEDASTTDAGTVRLATDEMALAGQDTTAALTSRGSWLAKASPCYMDLRWPGWTTNTSAGGTGSVVQTRFSRLSLSTGSTANTAVRAWTDRGWRHNLSGNANVALWDKGIVMGLMMSGGSTSQTNMVGQVYLGLPRTPTPSLPSIADGGGLPAIGFKCVGVRVKDGVWYGLVHDGTKETEVALIGGTSSGSGGVIAAYIIVSKGGSVQWYTPDGTLVGTTEDGPTGSSSVGVVFSVEVTNGATASNYHFFLESCWLAYEP